MNERQYQAELESIKEFGFIDPITVRRHPEKPRQWQIIDGEHRWRAAQELGIAVVDIVVLEVDDQQAKRLTVILNETRGKADTVELSRLLGDLSTGMSIDELLQGLPYGQQELSELIDMGKFDWDTFGDAEDQSAPQDQAPGGEEEWQRFTVAMPVSAFEVMMQARALIEQELQGTRPLHEDQAIARGQVIELLAAEYIAGPQAE